MIMLQLAQMSPHSLPLSSTTKPPLIPGPASALIDSHGTNRVHSRVREPQEEDFLAAALGMPAHPRDVI